MRPGGFPDAVAPRPGVVGAPSDSAVAVGHYNGFQVIRPQRRSSRNAKTWFRLMKTKDMQGSQARALSKEARQDTC